MANHSTQFEATSRGLALTNAILLYREPYVGAAYGVSRGDVSAFASIHDVDDQDGHPTIAAGTPLTRAHLRHWAQILGKAAPPEILPANVLVSHSDLLAWWVPARVRPAYFALGKPPADLKALAKRVVVPVPYPAHLLVATRTGLGVYALREDARPTAETQLLFSPILNVFVSGLLCWGNVPKPKSLNLAAIPAFESAVFDSWSTGPNTGQELTISGKGGLVRLWDDLATRKATRFPVSRLKAFHRGAHQQRGTAKKTAEPITFGKLISGGIQ
jgi:PRTRC genetic system protein B